MAKFQEEASRLETNSSLEKGEKRQLLVDKYSIVFRRLLHVLDQVLLGLLKLITEPPELLYFRLLPLPEQLLRHPMRNSFSEGKSSHHY